MRLIILLSSILLLTGCSDNQETNATVQTVDLTDNNEVYEYNVLD